MSLLNKKIGLIGCGNMGEAIVGAMVKGHIADPAMIMVSDAVMDRLDHIRSTYHVLTTQDNVDVFLENDVVVLAVKPQQMGPLLSDISRHKSYRIAQRKIVISIAAGISLKTIEKTLYAPLEPAARQRLPLIRVMPNTPALVLAGISGMSPNQYATAEDRKVAQTILKAMGSVIEFDEDDLDAVTALSGSGPAYVFYLVESMIAAGVTIGLEAGDAKTLTLATLKGALALLEQREESPEQLRKQVTSPGGTTEAALEVLGRSKVKESIIDAICAAKDRAKALSETMA